jgi:bifunctional NMN adenylyltransferase/nudix hydrolase
MQREFDFAVFIGRFQPFHAGHLQVIRAGLARADHLIVLIGSAWQPRTPRNPWTHQEREQMIRACLSEAEQARLLCAPLMDIPYNDEAWVCSAQATVAELVTAHHALRHRAASIALIGHEQGGTGFYLSLFPQWQSLGVPNHREISATPIRESFFAQKSQAWLAHLPAPVAERLVQFAERHDAYRELLEEMAFIANYRKAWEAAPYAPTFVTVDAVVVQSGHVLLIERRARPGKGLLALPGGFVDPGEKLLDACLRELREETRLKVPTPVLKGSIRERRVYDDPYRSARGRTITHAYYIELERQPELPKVKGGDDARRAVWVPLGELDPQTMFEDHYFIIQDLIGAG